MQAIIDGKTYELEFMGYDRATYKHEPGCLAYHPNDVRNGSCCQCGAAERADLWYQVKVPGRASAETEASRGIHPNCTPPCPMCDE